MPTPITMTAKRVLIVDDEPRFATFVERIALQMGFEVEVTNHGREFQKAYLRKRPDIVVIDMVMPDIDGNELVLWLVEQRYEADVIIITGYHPDYADNARLLAEFKGLHSVATLSKPVSIARLRQALSVSGGDHPPGTGATRDDD